MSDRIDAQLREETWHTISATLTLDPQWGGASLPEYPLHAVLSPAQSRMMIAMLGDADVQTKSPARDRVLAFELPESDDPLVASLIDRLVDKCVGEPSGPIKLSSFLAAVIANSVLGDAAMDVDGRGI